MHVCMYVLTYVCGVMSECVLRELKRLRKAVAAALKATSPSTPAALAVAAKKACGDCQHFTASTCQSSNRLPVDAHCLLCGLPVRAGLIIIMMKTCKAQIQSKTALRAVQ